MPIRITGMNSGLDTESIIAALMSAYRVKGDKYKKDQTKLSWTQDTWKSLNTKIYNMYKSLDNFRFSSGYNLKKVTISDTSKATVSGDSKAMNGTQSLKINQLAKAGYLTGSKINAANGKTKISDLDPSFSGGTIRISGNGKTKDIELSGDATVNDFLKELNDSGTGVTASYDATNKRIYISSKNTGSESDFRLSAMDEKGNQALTALGVNPESYISAEELDAWTKYTDSTGLTAAEIAQAGGDIVKANLTKALNEIIEAKKLASENKTLKTESTLDKKFNEDAIKYLEKRESVLRAEAEAGDAEAASAMSQLLKMSAAKQSKTYVMDDDGKLREKATDGSDDGKATYSLSTTKYRVDSDGNKSEVTSDNPVQEGDTTETKYSFNISGSVSKEYQVRDKYDEKTATAEEKKFADISSYGANQTAIKKYNEEADADIESGDYRKKNVVNVADADLTNALTDYNAKLEENKTDIAAAEENIKKANEVLDKHAVLGPSGIDVEATADEIDAYVSKLAQSVDYFSNVAANSTPVKDDAGNIIGYKQAGGNSDAKRVYGTDAEIELNGVTYTSSNNSFNINGLSIQAQAETKGEEVTITTSTDTQGIYDKIKDFISEYNSLIAEMSSLYNAESAKGYEPLTAEEKESMSEKEIEQWESKIKDSLLRRDGTLGSLINTMTTSMLTSVTVDGKKYSLASLGIKTSGYFNSTTASRNQLHIDGDEDDDTTSAKTNTLMNMLNSDPDKVIDIFKGITNELYGKLDKKMRSTRLSSINTVYNDKEMAQSYSDYTKTIRAWEEKMQTIEDNYYKKFSAMEVALSKLQSQQSSLAGLFGS